MIKDCFYLYPAVYLVFLRKGQVLLLQRFRTGYMDGKYSLPSGHIDGGEPALQAAIREAKEEVGVELKAKDLKLAHTMHRRAHEGDHERIDLFFLVKHWEGEPINCEPHKCSELRWVPIDKLPDNMVPEVTIGLNNIGLGKNYSDYNF